MNQEKGVHDMKHLQGIFICLVTIFSFFSSSAAAMEYEDELTKVTGTNWGFPGYQVTYTISDEKIAEIVKKNDGNLYVHFIQPGDVTIGVTFYQNGEALPPEYYLFHITGNAVDDTSFDWGTFAGDIIRLTNEERKKAGLPPLKPAFDLSEAALIRVHEASEYYSHERPDGTGFETVMEEGSYKTVGENLQAGAATPEEAIRQWMNSPTHRENILSYAYDEIAVGYVYVPDSRYHHYWVQLFRRK